jgi:Uma2 family endonuclease
MWPAQPPGMETGWDNAFIFGDVRVNLWSVFRELAKTHGGTHGSTDILVSDNVGLKPTHFYFAKPRTECLVRRDYFVGVPDLAIDVLSAATRWLARGRRMELYHRIGIRHLWLIEPELETVELYERDDSQFRCTRTCFTSDLIDCELFPNDPIVVADFFDTQFKRLAELDDDSEEALEECHEPIPEWIISPDVRVGLHHLLLLGHAESRYELWHGQGLCLLTFGSATEAKLRFQHFLEDICRFRQEPLARSTELDPNIEMAEVDQFRLTRIGQRVELEVAFDPQRFRELYETWYNSENWDFGEHSFHANLDR